MAEYAGDCYFTKGGMRMNVLVACEESQEVCKAFRARGHEAYSCDVQECSGGHPEWHILGDVLPILEPQKIRLWDAVSEADVFCPAVLFETMDGVLHQIPKWDLIIAHPPCTDLAVSGARHFARKRADGSQQRSIDFFMKFTNLSCERWQSKTRFASCQASIGSQIRSFSRGSLATLSVKKLAYGLKG